MPHAGINISTAAGGTVRIKWFRNTALVLLMVCAVAPALLFVSIMILMNLIPEEEDNEKD